MPLSNFENTFHTVAQAPNGVARLRELILMLAVQGKLVAQDASDEPASELLKKIRAEKDRLMAEGKIKKDKPLAEITEEEKPFELPVGWEWCRWNDVALKIGDIDHRMPEEVQDGIPYISPKDFYGLNEIDFDGAKKISLKDFNDLAVKIKPEIGDLIYPRYGTIGNVRLVKTDNIFLVSYSCATIKNFLGFIDPYFQYIYSISGFVKWQAEKATNKTTQPNVGLKSIQAFLFPLPPFAEQSRIVTRVEELMRLCDALEEKGRLEHTQHQQLLQAMLDSLTQTADAAELACHWQRLAQHFDLLIDRPEAVDALEQTILQLAVRGLLVPQDPSDEPASELLQKIRAEKDRLIAEGKIKKDKPLTAIGEDEKPFELPLGWEWARLGTLANFIDYRGKTPEKTESGIPLITAKNVRKGYINREPREFIAESAYDGWMTRGFPMSGDLLFTTEAPLGNVAVIDIEERFALAQRVICFSIFDRNMSSLLLNFLQSPWFQDLLASQASGVTAQGIKSSRLQQLPIPLPPLAEQSRIVARVTELRALCQQLREKLTQARTTQTQLAQAWVEQVAA